MQHLDDDSRRAGKATCTINDAQASTSYSATATFTDTDGNYARSSSSDSTAVVSKATPTAPTITNAPTGGTFGTGFTAMSATRTATVRNR